MNRPKRGISRDVFKVIEAKGSATYTAINADLKRNKVSHTPQQVKKCLDNLLQRKFIERSILNKRRFIVHRNIELEKAKGYSSVTKALFSLANPIELEKIETGITEEDIHRAVNKAGLVENRESGRIEPIHHTYEPISKLEYALIVGLSVAASVITTILLENL